MNAVTNGIKTPPHIAILFEVMAIKSLYSACDDLWENLTKLYNHMKKHRKEHGVRRQERCEHIYRAWSIIYVERFERLCAR